MHTAEFASSRIAEQDEIARRDEKLVTAARDGSQTAFEEIQKLYSHRLYKRILSITRNHEDAEDALQDTFLRAFLGIGSFEGRSQFSTWLTRIAINSALMCLRKRRTHVEMPFQEQTDSGEEIHSYDIRDTALNPEEIFDLRQRSTRIFSAIECLDPKLRSVIWIRISKECSMKEVAETFDVSLATVKARLSRARKRLAQFSAPASRSRRHPLPHHSTFAFELQSEKSHA